MMMQEEQRERERAPKSRRDDDSLSTTTSASQRRGSKCFTFCPVPRFSPQLMLRNMFVPKEMWDNFPNGLSYHITDYFLYQPDMPSDSRLFVESPARFQMPFEDVWIHTKDRVKIHGYLIKQNPNRLSNNNRNLPTILFFHGNAGNIGHRLDNVRSFYNSCNCNVLIVEYRGYGRSEGVPSEKGLYADAQAAFEYIDSRDDLDSKKVILFGRSLGGAVAIDLAARCDFRDRVAALIVENTFTNIPAIAKELFKFAILKWVPNFCYKNRFESLHKIGSVACPTLFISGTNDDLLPPSMSNELYSKCSASVKLLHRFPGGHNDTWNCKDYFPKIAEFIKEEVSNSADKRNSGSAKYQAYSDNIV